LLLKINVLPFFHCKYDFINKNNKKVQKIKSNNKNIV
jgi:hypothetical protein